MHYLLKKHANKYKEKLVILQSLEAYVHPSLTAGPRAWVYIWGKSWGHMIPLICAVEANSPLWAINHPILHKVIDNSVKFDHGLKQTGDIRYYVITNYIALN